MFFGNVAVHPDVAGTVVALPDKKMRSKTTVIEFEKKHRECRGQVIAEYAMFLAVTLVLIVALVFLMRAVGEHGEKSVERIAYSVP